MLIRNHDSSYLVNQVLNKHIDKCSNCLPRQVRAFNKLEGYIKDVLNSIKMAK